MLARLRCSHAFHSQMMEGMLPKFKKLLSNVTFSKAKIPFISNVTAKVAQFEAYSQPTYWTDHLRKTVNFSAGIRYLLGGNTKIFLELGPGNVLHNLVSDQDNFKKGHRSFYLVRHRKEKKCNQEKALQTLGELWCLGVNPNWSMFYENEQRKTVTLPTYPFERTRFPLRNLKTTQKTSLQRESETANWHYLPTWKIAPSVLVPQDGMPGICLVFMDQKGTGDAICELLADKEISAVKVYKGSGFAKKTKWEYTIDEKVAAHYVELISYLKQTNISPDTLLYLWWIDGMEEKENLNILKRQWSYLEEMKFLCTALQGSTFSTDMCCIAITKDVFSISRREVVSMSRSMAPTLLRVLNLEFPKRRWRHIDGDQTDGNTNLAEQFYSELMKKKGTPTVAFRNGTRFERIFDRIDSKPQKTVSFSSSGACLITGGLGDLGYQVSKYLINKGKNKLLLLGRTPIPAEKNWESVLTSTNTDPKIVLKIERIKALRALGADLKYYECDVANLEKLQVILKAYEEEIATVDAVIHAAGIVGLAGRKPLEALKFEDFEAQLLPKVKGVHHLKELFGSRELEFCLLISSLSALLGTQAYAAYSCANRYLDAYLKAFKQGSSLKNWLSVGLDGLNFNNSSQGITSEELFRSMDYWWEFLALEHLAISVTDLGRRYHFDWSDTKDILQRFSVLVDGEMDLNKEEIPNLGPENTEGVLLKVWRDFFGKPGLTTADNFFEIGGDSMKALLLLGRIQKVLGKELSMEDLFAYPTISELATKLQEGSEPNEDKRFKIPKAGIRPFYPTSSVQRRLFYTQRLNPKAIAYNMPMILRIKGKLDPLKIEGAFKSLIARHDILRTSVETIEDEPVLRIKETVPFELELLTVNYGPLDEIITSFVRPFDLGKAPLLRASLLVLSSEESVLMVDMHHIMNDAVSRGILIKDFMAFYKGEVLPDPNLQYKDFTTWQQGDDFLKQTEDERNFWIEEFADLPPELNLPLDFDRPISREFDGDIVTFELSPTQVRKLKKIAKAEGVTVFMLLLAVYYLLLNKLGDQEDIAIGCSTAGRGYADTEHMAGIFVNTLAIRNRPEGHQLLRNFLKELKSKVLQCFDHQSYQYEELIRTLEIERNSGRNPLFDVAFAFQNAEEIALELPDLHIVQHPFVQKTAKFDLLLLAREIEDKISFDFEYPNSLFTRQTVQRFVSYFQKLISQLGSNLDKSIGEITILDSKERNTLLKAYNDTKKSYPTKSSLPELFRQKVSENPENIALVYEDSHLTFKALDQRSDCVANWLISKSEKSGHVALYVEPSLEMMVGILGIWKSGKAFLPLDPMRNPKVTQNILEDSRAEVLLTLKNLKDNLSFEGHQLLLDHTSLSDFRGVVEKSFPKGDSLAYVIYTSGSTGTPKGVKVKHSNLVNYLYWLKEKIGLTHSDKALLTSSFAFDLGYSSLFPTLITGGELHLIPKAKYQSPDNLLRYVKTKKISYLKLTPSLFSTFFTSSIFHEDTLSSIRYILLGGESVRPKDVAQAKRAYPDIKFINHYGPTEATIGCIAQEIENLETFGSRPTIGSPIANTQVFVLGKDLKLLPFGAIGELGISGDGVAAGYFDRKDLEKGKFVPNPFEPGKTIYLSGDLGRWLPNGQIEFLGRRDNQVKIQGYRVEVSGIEKILLSHPSIKEGVVVVREEETHKYLIAYLVTSARLKDRDLRNYLTEVLPDYMVPAFFVNLEKLPLTPNGKVALKSLPAPVLNSPLKEEKPKNEMQRELIGIWASKLKLNASDIGVHTNFFDIGGNSINLIHVLAEINKRYPKKLTVAEMFKLPTVALIANRIQGVSPKTGAEVSEETLEADQKQRNKAIDLAGKLQG